MFTVVCQQNVQIFFYNVCLQNVHLDFMDIIVKKTAALIVLYPADVTALQVNVKADVKLDGRNLNVTQVGICHCLLNVKHTISMRWNPTFIYYKH